MKSDAQQSGGGGSGSMSAGVSKRPQHINNINAQTGSAKQQQLGPGAQQSQARSSVQTRFEYAYGSLQDKGN